MELTDLSWLIARLERSQISADPRRSVKELQDYFGRCASGAAAGLPSHDADLAWHEFLLCSREYEQFCDRLFGTFLHHEPHDRDAVGVVAAAGCGTDPSITGRSEPPLDLATRRDAGNSIELAARLKRGGRIPAGRVDEVLRDLRLFLCQSASGASMEVPTPWMDEAWHEWLLATADYRAFCFSVAGTIVHHRPQDSHPQ